MTENTDQLKGRVKESAGALTGNEDLEHEGKADRMEGGMKEKAEKAKDWVDDKVDEARDKMRRD